MTGPSLRDIPRRGKWLLSCAVIDALGYIVGWTVLGILATLSFGLVGAASLAAAQLAGSALATPVAFGLSRVVGSRVVLHTCAAAAVCLRAATFALLALQAPLSALVVVTIAMSAFAWAARAAHKAELATVSGGSSPLLLAYFGLAVAAIEAGGGALGAIIPGLDGGAPSATLLTVVGAIYAFSQMPLLLVGRRTPSVQAPPLPAGQIVDLCRTLVRSAWLPCAVLLIAGGPTLVRVGLATAEAGVAYVAYGALAMLAGALVAPWVVRRLPDPSRSGQLDPLLGIGLLAPWALLPSGPVGLLAAHAMAGLCLSVFKARIDVAMVNAVPAEQRVVALAAGVSSRDLACAIAAAGTPLVVAAITLPGACLAGSFALSVLYGALRLRVARASCGAAVQVEQRD